MIPKKINHVELLITDTIFEKLSKRYFENFKTKQLIQLASFLDPRYKAYCLNDCDLSIIKQLLIEELKKSGDQSGEINKNKSLSSKKKRYSGKFIIFKKKLYLTHNYNETFCTIYRHSFIFKQKCTF